MGFLLPTLLQELVRLLEGAKRAGAAAGFIITATVARPVGGLLAGRGGRGGPVPVLVLAFAGIAMAGLLRP